VGGWFLLDPIDLPDRCISFAQSARESPCHWKHPENNLPRVIMSLSTSNGLRDWARRLGRFAMFFAFAYVVGLLLTRSVNALDQGNVPAGFGRGVLHGAMMPCAMPSLLLGRDVQIYAANNSGRFYKLGYTVGVNGCGLLFFGYFFWRIRRWRKRGISSAN
jgi:hypothetical protein